MVPHKAVLILKYQTQDDTLSTPLGPAPRPVEQNLTKGRGVFYFKQQADGTVSQLQLVNAHSPSRRPTYFEVIGKLVGFLDDRLGMIVEVTPTKPGVAPFRVSIEMKRRMRMPMGGLLKVNGTCPAGALVASKIKVVAAPERRRPVQTVH